MSDVGETLLLSDEKLARFVLKTEWLRKIDNTVKQDAFIPPKDLQLSVTRHTGISSEQLTEAGKLVAAQTSLQFLGRADIKVQTVVKNALKAVAWPLENNANHAHVIGWPADKESRKTIAQELAAASKFISA